MKIFTPESATKISSTTAFFLMVGKLIVGVLSGSIAVLASALDSALDFLVSIMNYFTVKESQKPADTEHPFGHEKFEAFAELIQGIVIGFSGMVLGYYGIQKIITPQELQYENLALWIMIGSLGITSVLFLYLRYTAKKTNSLVVKADTVHYQSDILSNIALIGGIVGMMYFNALWIDGALSLIMAGFIIFSSAQLIRESFKILTDHEIQKGERKKIEKILDNATGIDGWHQLRTRYSGSGIFVDVHLEFNSTMLLKNAHDIGHKIEKEIEDSFQNISILTHFDPHEDQ